MKDRFISGRPFVAACAAALTLGSGTAQADASDFDWLGVLYLWGSDISVDSRDASIDASFNDVLNKLEMAFQTHVEVQGDDLGGFIDFTFMGLGDNSSHAAADFHTDLDMTLMDLAVVYSPGAERMTGFELFGGLRYIDSNFHVVVDPVLPGVPNFDTRVNDTFSDLLVGARYIAPLNDRWRLTFTGDVSGGQTEGTWSVGAFAGYRTGPHHFIVGYRHLEVEVQSGGSTATETYTGPIVAYGISF